MTDTLLIIAKALASCVFAIVVIAVALVVGARLVMAERIVARGVAVWFKRRWQKRFHAWLGKVGI